MFKLITKIRIFLWLLLLLIILWLLYMAVVPGGRIEYVYDFDKENYFISKLSPDTRVEAPQNGAQKIIGDPAYFSLYTPRPFDAAKLKIKYRRCGDAPQCAAAELPVIEAGVLVDKTVWRYGLEPIENHIINQLSLVWDKIEAKTGNTILLQRDKRYDSIEAFLNNLPPARELAVYNYDLNADYILPDYQAGGEVIIINRPIRGNFEFFTYIKDEDLDFEFTIMDLNQNRDPDPLDLYLYYNNQLIDSRRLEDDGNASDNGEASEDRVLNFSVGNLPEGAYKLEARCNDDIVTKKISTRQSKLAFINNLWLYQDSAENDAISLFTDSRQLSARTADPKSLQTIKAGAENFIIGETYKQFSFDLAASNTEIIFRPGDIKISGDGVFSFNKNSPINPRVKKVNKNLDINGQSIDYVIAGYKAPEEISGWKLAEAEFDLSGAYRENGKFSFIISVPGLRADDGINDYIEIDEIRVELEGKSLWKKIKQIFNF